MANILLITKSRAVRLTLKDRLEAETHQIQMADSLSNGVRQLSQNSFDCVITDCTIPSIGSTPWIIITTDKSPEFAERMIEKGASDCITIPISMPQMSAAILRALQTESKSVADVVSSAPKPPPVIGDRIIGNSPSTQHLRKVIDLVAPTTARVLIVGENGTGKELVAQAIHQKSKRSSAPFVEINCAAIPSELIESELFGHEKGAFTSAIKSRAGKFEQANGGTLFLDEIGDMSLAAQSKMLRVLEEQTITHVGSNVPLKVSVRIVAATNKNLYEEIAAHRFREDLYHRLAVVVIGVPPLRERREDIPILVRHFIRQLSDEHSLSVKEIEKDAVDELCTLSYSGNIRELRNICERLLILSQNTTITLADIKAYACSGIL